MAEPTSAKVGRPKRPQTAAEKGQSRLGDSTRPIAIDRRLTTSRRTSQVFLAAGAMVAIALAASLFVAPLQKYFQQDAELEARTDQLARMRAMNAELESEVERLDTAAGIEEAAREEVGLQNPGEDRVTVIETGAVPAELPPGWPYDLVTRIVATKRATG